MARCERGYLCAVCGQEVEHITESDLYLSYILGEVAGPDLLHHPERHIRCNPERAQYIIDPAFEPIVCEGMFSKDAIDREYVKAEEDRITRAWKRLQNLTGTIGDYPLDSTRS